MRVEPLEHLFDTVRAGQVGVQHCLAQPHHVTVGVDQPRNHGASFEIHHRRVRKTLAQCIGIAHRQKPTMRIPSQRFGARLIRVHGMDFCVGDDAARDFVRTGLRTHGNQQAHRGHKRRDKG